MRFKKFSIIISLALVMVCLGSFVAPSAQALFLPGSGGSYPGFVPYITSTLGDWIISQGFDWMLDQSMDVAGFLGGLIFDDICPYNTDSHRHDFKPQNVDGNSSRMVFVCQYCGKYGDEVLNEVYGTPSTNDSEATGFVNHVQSELGTTVVGKDGFYLPIPGFKICDPWGDTDNLDPDSVLNPPYASFLWKRGAMGFGSYSPNFLAPVSGEYTLVYDFSLVNCILYDYKSIDISKSYSVVKGQNIFSVTGLKRGGDNYISCLLYFDAVDSDRNSSVRGYFFFKVVPHDYHVENFTSPIGGMSSRPTSFTGDIGIIGDNGQLTKVEGNQIFNETTNNYYNPSTGTTSTVTDWFYDYSDRSYHLTLESGDTVTVTYGDENITIQEGDTTYNVYYIIEGSASTDSCPEGGAHDWQAGETVDATCTVAGFKTETCSKCGEERTTELPALGHKWKVKQSIQTKYDENGELLQQGYTIYECERCGEQYKSTDSSGPPGGMNPGTGSGGGTDSGGDDGDSIWDSIADFFKNIASSFASLPDWFSRFSEFLSSAFSYLPEEIVLLLTFGVFSVVAIGIWKAVRR